jgi:diacylglycerol kinase (ATP)
MARYSRVLVFYNRASGRGLSEEAWKETLQRLRGISESLDEIVVEPGLDIAKRAAESVNSGVNLVIAAGGDGTVREAAAGLVGTSIPLGIIPIGTFNNLALSLDLPHDPILACELIESGATRAIDVGVADGRNFFFEAAGVGVDADLFPIGEQVKSGRFSGILRAIRLALMYKQTSITLRFDRPVDAAYRESFRGKSLPRRRKRFRKSQSFLTIRCSFIAIGNCPYYGSNFNVCPGALLDDGLLSIGVYRDFSKRELFWHFWSISGGRRQYNPKLEMFEAKMVEVTPKRLLSVHVDGKPIGTTPVRFEVRPGALQVLAPARKPAESTAADLNVRED